MRKPIADPVRGVRCVALLAAVAAAACSPGAQPAPSGSDAPSLAAPAPTSAPAQKRLSWQTFSQDAARVASLEKAVRVMKGRDGAPRDSAAYRTSWQYWSAMHGYYGPQAQAGPVADARNSAPASARRFYDGIADLTPPAQPPDVAQKVWDKCQHGTDHFLTWHRMYLYYFERVLRAAAEDRSLRLPYWDYSDPARVDFPATLGQPLYEGRPNALFDTRRRSQTVRLDPLRTNIDGLLRQASFSVFEGNLEQQPHGYVHCAVGGQGCPIPLMGDVPVAATDPVFWMHHANIDRIWECWLRGGGQVPNGAFRAQSFDFIDETGSLVSLTVGKLLGPDSPIDYVYEKAENCGRAAALEADEPQGKAPMTEPEKTTVDQAAGVTLDTPSKAVSLKLPKTGAPAESLKRALGASKAPGGAIELRLEGITVDAPPGVMFDVFLARKGAAAAQRQYVGTLTFFGVGGRHKHGASSLRVFDVTEHVRAALGGALDADAVEVQFEATTGLPDAKPEDARPLLNKRSGLKIATVHLKVVK
jgi:hypothetical protein